jgi:TIR domain-containing protein
MSKYFISYRREDSKSDAVRIAERFREHFGDADVFFDTLAIDAGARWIQRIDQALAQAEVMLVVIGPKWLSVQGADGLPRLFAEGDVVAYEIAAALAHGIRVIPLCLDNTPLPAADRLPPALRSLLNFNAFNLRTMQEFDRDAAALIDEIEGKRDRWRALSSRQRRLVVGGSVAALAVGLAAFPMWMRSSPVKAPIADSAPASAPSNFDMELEVRLQEAPGDDRAGPEMKLWHRAPVRSRAVNISLLDAPRQVGPNVLQYLSGIPNMPGDGDRYEGTLTRVALTGRPNAQLTQVCFVADLKPKKKDSVIRMACPEGADCTVSPHDPGWARACDAPKVSWLSLLPSAHAAQPRAANWAIPELQTLKRPDNAGHAYSEVRLASGPMPNLKEATKFTYGLAMNGQPLLIDGLPPEAYPLAFDAGKGINLSFGLENLDASGSRGGYEDLRMTLTFFRDDKPVRSIILPLRFVALRSIEGAPVESDGVRFEWSAQYHPGRREDLYQIFMTSSPNGAALQDLKSRFDSARLSTRVNGSTAALVAVLRPPLGNNLAYGLNIGTQAPNGQIKFTFDDATSASLCASLLTTAKARPDLIRADSYRRTVDGTGRVQRCTTASKA